MEAPSFIQVNYCDQTQRDLVYVNKYIQQTPSKPLEDESVNRHH